MSTDYNSKNNILNGTFIVNVYLIFKKPLLNIFVYLVAQTIIGVLLVFSIGLDTSE